MSKRVKEWDRERAKLKKEYQEKGIATCEIKLEGCMREFSLSFAHKHKRVWYYDKPGLLGDFNETILACAYCHAEIEKDNQITEDVFNNLRQHK